MSKVNPSILTNDKKEIVNEKGNVLVIANPGTGKTFLLTFKYCQLIEQGISPEEILCLTFTNKAKKELEERIFESIKEYELSVDFSKVQVHTFHSYANEIMGEQELVSPNLLRYSIYKYIKEKQIFNYEDDYLLNTIVPKIENSIRYLKNYGILPTKINLEEVKKHLEEVGKVSKEEIELYSDYFLSIFEYYENIKNRRGIDYGDMLINCLNQEIPKFKYVLVDELQDVNNLEAEIALKSSMNFIAVGDKKQAIFGFQGGSILNFKLFNDSKKFTLVENSRSTQEILDYAKEFFSSKTEEKSHKEDLEKLVSSKDKHGDVPKVITTSKENIILATCDLAEKLKNNGREVAIIARTNSQILELSKILKEKNVEHTSTYSQSSEDIKKYIISFLEGILSNDLQKIKNSMFTPFFPIDLKDAFRLSQEKILTLEDLFNEIPKFKVLRESVNELKDLESIFKRVIIPVSIRYGKEGYFSALSVYSALFEALKTLTEINLEELINYIKSSSFDGAQDPSRGKINLITTHKSKGLQYQDVIYLPKSSNNAGVKFQDALTEGILESLSLNAHEEVSEEQLRIDFVAITRPKEDLYILTDKPGNFLNSKSKEMNIESISEKKETTMERANRAFNFFLQGHNKEARELLDKRESWIFEFVKNHFENLDRLSFSKLNVNPEEYLIYNLLNIQTFSSAMTLGNKVHKIAEELLQEKSVQIEKEYLPYKENIEKLISKIKKDYSEVFSIEEEFRVSVKELFGIDEEILFKGFIDCVFKNQNEEYLIVDWKTTKNTSKASTYRRQLEGYRHAFSKKHKIPLEKIKIAIAFVGLKPTINLGTLDYSLEDSQPRKDVISTLQKHVEKILSWKKDPNFFFNDLIDSKIDNPLVKEIIEEYTISK